jgi:Uma2 family endonuclease
VDGAIVVSQPNYQHGFTQSQLIGALSAWTNAERGRGVVLAPIDVTLTDRDVDGPVALWMKEVDVPSGPGDAPPRVPELAVEIRSPSTWRYDTGRKRDVYETGGLPELWLVDPYEEVVTICRRSASDTPTFDIELQLGVGETLCSPLLPGFELLVERLFRR